MSYTASWCGAVVVRESRGVRSASGAQVCPSGWAVVLVWIEDCGLKTVDATRDSDSTHTRRLRPGHQARDAGYESSYIRRQRASS